jgi:hypothetical protein
MRFYYAPQYVKDRSYNHYFASNYWGGAPSELIDIAIVDYTDNFDFGKIIYEPILATPPTTAYPFVVNVAISNSAGQAVTTIGAEQARFTVTFNRDMDTTTQPQVSFGPAEPYTDYKVFGVWQNPRTWVGTFNINPLTGDGYQYPRVVGARAADDHWLVTGDDYGRFRFEIVTSGAESLNLQATGGEGYVDLFWSQDDFDLLAGYHLYRATTVNGTYTRINPSIIPAQTKTFRDVNVAPGQPYFYKFTVLKTDMQESDYSNIATATPLDTIAPVIVHTPLTTAAPGLALTLTAQVTDNVAVRGVTVYHRKIGTTTYANRPMVKTTGNAYSASLEGSLLVSPGVEYYIAATDGITTVNFGRPEYPYQIQVVDNPVVTAVSPVKGPASGGTTVTLAGSNFKTGASVTFGGVVASSISVVNANQITCVTPAHFPTVADVVVSNPGNQTGALLRAFTFESDVASLSLPTLTAGRTSLIQVPINAAGLVGLAAADVTITFDASVLSPRGATTGALTSGWSQAVNTGTAGQVRLAMASSGGTITGSGVLAYVHFEVTGLPGATSTLGLAGVALNSGAIPVSTAGGTVDVEMVYGIAGTVALWNNATAIAGVDMQLNGARLYTGQTNSAGVFSVAGAPPGAYTLRPGKSDDANGITAYDAALVLRHAAGLALQTGMAARAADVDKSGAVDSMDAFHILQRASGVLGLPFPGAGVVWEFEPPSRAYNPLNSNQTGQDFTGVLLGDVSGNWSSQEPLLQLLSANSIRYVLREFPPAPNRTLLATLSVKPSTQAVYSVDLILTYDPAKGTPTSVENGTGVLTWLKSINLSKPGEIRVAMASPTPITTDAVVLSLKFDLLGQANSVDLLAQHALINEQSALEIDYASMVSESAPYAEIFVRRTGNIQGALDVNYSTEDGTATAGNDYIFVNGSLHWGDGDGAAKLINVPILNDALHENKEEFNVIIGSALALVTIADDDPLTSFGDIPGNWATQYIQAIYGAGVTSGCASGYYCPGDNVTRDQMAVFIVRAVEGNPSAGYCGTSSPFTDVPSSHWACGHIKRLRELNITTGLPDGSYLPGGYVTRAQMAAFLVRAIEGEPAANYCGVGSGFGDVSVVDGMCKYIKRLAELGVTTGCGGGNYCPSGYVTREQMAAFLGRAFLGM